VEERTIVDPGGPAAHPVDDALADASFVEFAAAGAPGDGDFRCAECGYGAVVHHELPQCPMCGGTVWEQSRWGRLRLPPGEPLQ